MNNKVVRVRIVRIIEISHNVKAVDDCADCVSWGKYRDVAGPVNGRTPRFRCGFVRIGFQSAIKTLQRRILGRIHAKITRRFTPNDIILVSQDRPFLLD